MCSTSSIVFIANEAEGLCTVDSLQLRSSCCQWGSRTERREAAHPGAMFTGCTTSGVCPQVCLISINIYAFLNFFPTCKGVIYVWSVIYLLFILDEESSAWFLCWFLDQGLAWPRRASSIHGLTVHPTTTHHLLFNISLHCWKSLHIYEHTNKGLSITYYYLYWF